MAVRQERARRSRMSTRGKHRLLHQYMAERSPISQRRTSPAATLWPRVWREWFGPGGARQRYLGTAEMLDDIGPRVGVHRPGQVVALDSTPLPVKLRESVFGEPVSVMLTPALDVYTHSCCASRPTIVSDTSVDIVMLPRDVMMPLPMWDPTPELYYKLLRKHHVMIHPRRGVKILGLYYYDPVLDEHRVRATNAGW